MRVPSSLPPALWVPSGSFRVYRGSAVDIVRDMVGGLPTEEAIEKLVVAFWKAREVSFDLPWGLPEEDVAAALLHALLERGITQPVPQA